MKLLNGHEEWKIYPLYEVFYIESIKIAAESAVCSREELNRIISDPVLLRVEGLRTVDLSENIVNQSGIISRYFFPTRDWKRLEKDKIHQLRAEKLRHYYKIEENNIWSNRKFRNYIEHFDENLDEFLNQPIAGNIIPKSLFRTSSEINSVTFVFKAYVINEFKFISLNEEIELQTLVKEIFKIYNFCIDFLEKGGRLSS